MTANPSELVRQGSFAWCFQNNLNVTLDNFTLKFSRKNVNLKLQR
jgi:hypothetical protein